MYGIVRDCWYNGHDAIGPWSIFFVAIPWLVGTVIGYSKGRGVFGFLLSFLFSWMGVIVIGAFPSRKVK